MGVSFEVTLMMRRTLPGDDQWLVSITREYVEHGLAQISKHAPSAEVWRVRADISRVLLCVVPRYSQSFEAESRLFGNIIRWTADPSWDDVVLCNPGAVLDFLAIARLVHRVTKHLGFPDNSPCIKPVWALRKVLSGPYVLRSEWVAHHYIELVQAASELQLDDFVMLHEYAWTKTSLSRQPALWRWRKQKEEILYRLVIAMGADLSKAVTVMSPSFLRYLQRASDRFLGASTQTKNLESVTRWILTSAVLTPDIDSIKQGGLRFLKTKLVPQLSSAEPSASVVLNALRLLAAAVICYGPTQGEVREST